MSTVFTTRDGFEAGSYYARRSTVNLPDSCILAVDSTSTGEVFLKLIGPCSSASMTLNTEQARALAAELLASAEALAATKGGDDGS